HLHQHDYLYYAETRPETPDAEYDEIMRELPELEAALPDPVTSDSPTQRGAGHPFDAFRPIQQRATILSLDNATWPEELRDFEARNRSLQDAGEATFANPRNAAGGAVREKDPASTASRPVEIFLYHVSAGRGLGFRTYWEALEALREAGFKTKARAERCPSIG